jgi:hypothetical protein
MAAGEVREGGLSAEQLAQFDRDGILLVPGALTAAETEAMKCVLRALWPWRGWGMAAAGGARRGLGKGAG